MAEILTNKENLLKYGYCVVRNLLSNKDTSCRMFLKESQSIGIFRLMHWVLSRWGGTVKLGGASQS